MALKPVLLDTNLLLLLTVGETDQRMIARHKRLQSYELDDFKWLQNRVRQSGGLLLCPNIVSETSNLVRYAPSRDVPLIAEVLKAIIATFSEHYTASKLAAQRPEYSRLGVTDAVLLILAETEASLVTDDLDLALAAAHADADVINYNHIRDNR